MYTQSLPAHHTNRIFPNFTTANKKAVIVLEKIRNREGEVYAILRYNPDKNYLLMKWVGHSTEDEVKLASLKMLDWQRTEGKAKKCHFHMHDTKEIQGAWIGLVDWINTEMFPACHKYGLRYNLSVTSPDLFSKMSSRALQEQESRLVPTLLFETISQAETWLTEKYKSL